MPRRLLDSSGDLLGASSVDFEPNGNQIVANPQRRVCQGSFQDFLCCSSYTHQKCELFSIDEMRKMYAFIFTNWV